jgi:membrane associated rhomboid family serine protease
VFFRNQKIQLDAVKVLIGLNILAFVLVEISPDGGEWVDRFLGLSERGVAKGMIWQFVTYQFVHAGVMHLLVNMIGIWFAGSIIERIMGYRRFVVFYLLCGIAGGVLQLVLSPGPVVVGASGAVCGLVAGFSTMFPRMEITALIFFVIPVKMQAKWLGIGIAVVSFLLWITDLFPNVGNAAHLGGAIAGFLLVKWNRRQPLRVV